MMGPGEVMIALIVIGLPILTIFYGFHRFFIIVLHSND